MYLNLVYTISIYIMRQNKRLQLYIIGTCACRTHCWHLSSESSGQGPCNSIMPHSAIFNFWFSRGGVALILQKQAKGSREKNLRRSQVYVSFSNTLPSTSSALKMSAFRETRKILKDCADGKHVSGVYIWDTHMYFIKYFNEYLKVFSFTMLEGLLKIYV